MPTGSGSLNRFDHIPRWGLSAVCGLIAVKLAFVFFFAWHTRFVMDEFVQFGWAKYIPDQIGALAVQHPKAEGYAVLFKLAHLIGRNAPSMLLIGRMEMALLACGTLALIYATARSLGHSRTRGALIVLILLSFSNFIERIFETRGDPLAVFFAAASLLVVLRGDPDKPRDSLAAGILTGLAFLATQKSLYFNVALGLALVGDALLAQRYKAGLSRGAWLLFGWALTIAAYCFVFGGTAPLPVLHNLLFGPIDVATHGADAYSNLRQYVVQTLTRNALLYAFCFGGMVLSLLRITKLDGRRRIALIFSVVITAFVFAHDQPWPYVFIMAIPFMALWALEPLDALAGKRVYVAAAWAVLGIAVLTSFARNVQALRIDNHAQLALVDRAEKLVGPGEVYFDGVGMLPNRTEPSTLWLDRHAILITLREGTNSEAYRIFANSPPKVILWSYRMDAIMPVVAPLIRDSYVQVAPNIRMAGVELRAGATVTFDVPIAGTYAAYDLSGRPVPIELEVGDAAATRPLVLRRGRVSITLRRGPGEVLLVRQGSYAGRFEPGADKKDLFAKVYD